jgi:hypothetical protein
MFRSSKSDIFDMENFKILIILLPFFFFVLEVCFAKEDYGSLSNIEYYQSPSVKASRNVSSEVQISWTTQEAKARFNRADKTNFFTLSNQFEAQVNKFYCGPASASIVLNALRVQNQNVKKPTDQILYRGPLTTLPKDFNPVFERYTQDAFFNEKTNKIKTRNQVFGDSTDSGSKDYGLQLRQLGEMLKTYQLIVSIQIVSADFDLKTLRNDLIKNLVKEGHFIIVNYSRPSLGQKGGGHISPLGAYDVVSDSVLIMDVNPSHQPWVWVKVDALIEAMRTKDTLENRGYLVISEGYHGDPAVVASKPQKKNPELK